MRRPHPRSASGLDIQGLGGPSADKTQQHEPGICDCETCRSPSTIGSNMLSSATGHNLFLMDNALTDDTSISQGASISNQIQQQQDALQQQMNPMQSIPWAGAGPDTHPFNDNMLDGTGMPPIVPSHPADCPAVINPMLLPPITSSDPLGQPMLNSWIGLGDPGDLTKNKTLFSVVG
ncbi:hypothetical protein IL306_013886 [Fusarium sp. DS 682]|nr:hypothetical protein IL306_013886 [Fusarium sp. DS 682]